MGHHYFMVPSEVACRTDLTCAAKVLLGAVMNRIGRNGCCWAGLRRLARDCGVGLSTAVRGLAALEEAGLLVVERRGLRQTNVYRLSEGMRAFYYRRCSPRGKWKPDGMPEY